MRSSLQHDIGNHLLRRLSAEDFLLLQPNLEHLDLGKGQVLTKPNRQIEHVYFPQTAIGSVIAIAPDGHQVEAGLFGRDGFSPTSLLLGSDRTPHECVSQAPGAGWRIGSAAMVAALDASKPLRGLLLRYVEAFAIQVAFTALSNAVYTVEQRLARWLLMCFDRTDLDEVALTHEFLSIMLGVRRPSVTTSLHVLEGHGFIRSARGCIILRNRQELESFAGAAYGRPEAEYERLLGPS